MNAARTGIAAVAASALLAVSAADAEPKLPARAYGAHWDARHPASLTAHPVTGRDLIESLLAAAEAGDGEAMNLLGVVYILGLQVPSDTSQALEWFQKAIDRGSASAMHNLAQMYLHGIGMPRDYVNAFHWFQRSAAFGNVHSAYNAAVMAENGLGTTRDQNVSRAMYLDAAKSGYAPAMVKVSDDLAGGTPAQRNLVDAYAWLQIVSQSQLAEELQIVVLAKLEALGARLGPDRRNAARARAAEIVAEIRARSPSDAPGITAPMPARSHNAGRMVSMRLTGVPT